MSKNDDNLRQSAVRTAGGLLADLVDTGGKGDAVCTAGELAKLCAYALRCAAEDREENGREWVSVVDELPDIGVSVLLYAPEYIVSEGLLATNEGGEGEWQWSDGAAGECEPTHWMPLPPDPTEQTRPQSDATNEQEGVSDWIPLTERMPDNEVVVQAYDPGIGVLAAFYVAECDVWETVDSLACKPTHWKPLSAPPG